jgi:hypothetical protein
MLTAGQATKLRLSLCSGINSTNSALEFYARMVYTCKKLRVPHETVHRKVDRSKRHPPRYSPLIVGNYVTIPRGQPVAMRIVGLVSLLVTVVLGLGVLVYVLEVNYGETYAKSFDHTWAGPGLGVPIAPPPRFIPC